MDYNPELVGELYHALDAAPPFALIPVLSVALKGSFEARAVDLLLADYAEKSLTFVESKGHDERAPVPVDGSVPGRCYIGQCPTGEPTPSGWTTYLPVTVRSERLGALAIVLPAEPDAGALRVLAQVASAVAHVLITASRYTDVFERVRRRRDLVLAAELQWELLPVLGYECEQFSLAAILERTRHETPLEVVRSVLAQIVEYRTGPLRDDATLLCLDWAGDADEPL